MASIFYEAGYYYPDFIQILMICCYILKSEKTDSYYVGCTENINARLALHNAGRVRATKSGVPWNLFYKESFANLAGAFRREQQIKKWKSRKAIERLVKSSKI